MLSGMGVRRAAWAGGSTWNPTNLARIASNGDTVYARGRDDQISPGPALSTADAGIWILRTGGEIYVRVGCDATGNTVNIEQWYNTGGTGQGAPGTISSAGTTIFTIGGDTGVTVNLYIANAVTVSGTPSFSDVPGGSWTNDDKSTFFTPTADTKYGRRVVTSASQSGIGISNEEGYTDLQITFRKSGETDYTITYRARADSEAFVEP